MSTSREGKNKKKKMENVTALSWQEKKEIADKEDDALAKEINDLKKWTDMVEEMNDEQLKEYLKSGPEELKSLKMQKKKQPRQRVQKVRKTRCSTSSSTGIMASVWKFHREDDDDSYIRLDA
ncbi:uncharacterized protein [Euphorbia lathyris]|uniref:uncharacterized protein n=1 Tax=Euphorbia lathyris TaxID=212925 RepID=UPI0033140619